MRDLLKMKNNYSYKYEDKGIYCYKGSNVLINKLYIKNEGSFDSAERLFSGIRQASLEEKPLSGKLDFEYLKSIHQYLFQDLFMWAGQIRTVAIAKGNLFCLPQFIEVYAKDIFKKLKQDNYYQGSNQRELVDKITELLGDINALHPFREGNGRTQREFIRCVAGINGFGLNWSLVKPIENIESSFESVNGDNTKLHTIIERIIYTLSEEEHKKFLDTIKL